MKHQPPPPAADTLLSDRLDTYASIIQALLECRRYGMGRRMSASLMADLRDDANAARRLERDAFLIEPLR